MLTKVLIKKTLKYRLLSTPVVITFNKKIQIHLIWSSLNIDFESIKVDRKGHFYIKLIWVVYQGHY